MVRFERVKNRIPTVYVVCNDMTRFGNAGNICNYDKCVTFMPSEDSEFTADDLVQIAEKMQEVQREG